jgi:hypothetical protein
MTKRLRDPYRNLAVAAVILGLIAYGVGRGAALANSGAQPILTLPALQGAPAVQQLKEHGLYDSLAQALDETRYKLQWDAQPALSGLPAAYHADNPSQRLAAYFTPTELHLASIAAVSEFTASAPSTWRAAMRFAGYGYGENLMPVPGIAELTAEENRIEYRRPTLRLTEWYANRPQGLEQGFTIDEPPGGRPEGQRLRLLLELTGDLRAESIEGGQAIALRHVNAKMALRYGELHAYDANEQLLPSQLRVEGGRIILEVEDARAVYPLTIDPLLTQQQKLTPGDGPAEGRHFGESVAISGQTAVVARRSEGVSGSVYVFVRNGTTWNQQQKLTPSDPNVTAFGKSVAISGNTIVVGTTYIHPNGIGAAFVFVLSGATWNLQQKLTASDGVDGDYLGTSVAISEDTIVAGAPGDDTGSNLDQGSVYVFVRSGATWSQQQKLTASNGAASDWFGSSVGISGDTLIAGAARGYTADVPNQQGSAYVFVRSGSTWSEQQKLTAGNGEREHFGNSVAISGDTAVVGADYGDIGANENQGAAYVFVRNGDNWSQQQKLSASDGMTFEYFGKAVAISGDAIVVGAFADDIGANAEQGSAYVFFRNGTAWSEQQKLTASDGAANDVFGYSVAISGDTVVVGAPREWDLLSPSAVYVFATWGEQQKLSAPDWAANDLFGLSVAISGNTAVVGAYLDDIGANINQGSAYVFLRSVNSWSFQQKLIASDGAASDGFGSSVAISGDTAIVGSSFDDVGANSNQGSAYVFVRSGNSWSQQQKLIVSDGATSDYFGASVAIDGETVVVGAFRDDVGADADQGSAYVFVRSGASWSLQQKLTASDGAAVDWFGLPVAVSGETIVVGAYLDDIGADTDQGSAYVFVRSGAAWSQQQKLTAADGAAYDNFGTSLAISGDTAVVGAPYDDVGADTDQGSAYVFVRSGATWSQEKKLTARDGAPDDKFGSSIAISGETAIVGSPFDNIAANAAQGSAYVFLRDGTSWSLQHKLTGSTGAASDRFGWSVAISGNTVVAGAPYSDKAYIDQGSAYVFVRK